MSVVLVDSIALALREPLFGCVGWCCLSASMRRERRGIKPIVSVTEGLGIELRDGCLHLVCYTGGICYGSILFDVP